MKGFVTALYETDTIRKLLPIDGLSGTIPSFDEAGLASLRWAATHYVSPLSVLMKRTVPPNVPRITGDEKPGGAKGARGRTASDAPVYQVGAPPFGRAVANTIERTASADRSVVVIAPTAVEVADIARHLEGRYKGRVVMATSSMPARTVTRTWIRIATDPGTILVGTREVMFWPFGGGATVVIVEDGRRVMRSPGTPTLSVREVVLHRSRHEGFTVVFHGPVPTLEIVAAGAGIRTPGGRQWPEIEVVDRGEDPPGAGSITERVKAALRSTTARDEPSFVLVGSRGYAPAFTCVSCADIRRCPTCQSAASRDDLCRRCGQHLGNCASCGGRRFQPLGEGIGRTVDDIRRFLGDKVGQADEKKLVTVGSERDLIGVVNIGLAVAIDVDGLTMAPHYRASEDALRLLVRLAQTVRRGGSHRCLLQTVLPRQDVLTALVSGRSGSFLDAEMHSRDRFGFPPVGSLIAIETDGEHGAAKLIEEHIGQHATVLGPADVGGRTRWLIQGRNLDRARLALRSVLTDLRAEGAKVRVDVDPIDL